jgi:hypothetical protein
MDTMTNTQLFPMSSELGLTVDMVNADGVLLGTLYPMADRHVGGQERPADIRVTYLDKHPKWEAPVAWQGRIEAMTPDGAAFIELVRETL